ncbi:hypothetical protein [Sphingobium yanoikuyae]|uniref:hypothetical protein n=1 Tax=Sphingobium yanoikuyae TaxID=13690 RepID=UPI0022DD8860|nr:hypothetical protein [Sphingobium yanoikuyae]WBQ17637.1 hypothetical protein PAE53_05360 [Sphingobium yanoikuyae]
MLQLLEMDTGHSGLHVCVGGVHQLFSLILVDWILPNPEKDTPLRWSVRIALVIGAGLILANLA